MQIKTNHTAILSEYNAHLTLSIEHERCLMMIRSCQVGISSVSRMVLSEDHADILQDAFRDFDVTCDSLVNHTPTGTWAAMRRLQAAVTLKSEDVIITDAELTAIDILSDVTKVQQLAETYLRLLQNLNQLFRYINEEEAREHLPALLDMHKYVTEYTRFLEQVVESCVKPKSH